MRTLCYVLLGLTAMWLSLPVRAADDPRPCVLLIGDRNLQPYDYAPSVVYELQQRRPDWRVVSIALDECTITKILDGLDGLLKEAPRADAVAIVTGSYEVFDGNYAVVDAGICGQHMRETLRALAAHPKTAGAKQIVITPLPVFDARMDAWAKGRITSGEERSDLVARFFREAATDAGAQVIDLHTWAKAFGDPMGKDARPGWLLGSRGWMLREWGLSYLGQFLGDQFAKVTVPARNPAAFAAWRAEYDANRALDRILATTSEGLVAHGEPLAAERKTPQALTLAVPPALLASTALDLLLEADGPGWSCIQPGSTFSNAPAPVLTVEVEGSAAPLTITSPSYAWQVIAEDMPDQPVPANRWLVNRSYKDYWLAVVQGDAGKRMSALLRFDLGALAGKTVLKATLTITPATPTVGSLPGRAGAGLRISPITGPDRSWSYSAATWRTRDGALGWTGGAVDTAKRRASLTAFLATNPPAAVRARAEAELAALPAP